MYNPQKPVSFVVSVEDRLNGDKWKVIVSQNSVILTQEQAEVHVFTRPGSLGGYHPGLTVTPVDQAKFDTELAKWKKANPDRVAALEKREEDHKNDVVAEQALRAQVTGQQQ